MLIPIICGTAGMAAFFALKSLGSEEKSQTEIAAKLLASFIFGVVTGSLVNLVSQPTSYEAVFVDKQVVQNGLLNNKTVAIVKTEQGEKRIDLPGVQALGLNKGDRIAVKGVKYFSPAISEFDSIEKL